MDNRTGASIILMAFIEITTLGWFYGVGRYWENIVEMGMRIPTVMKYYWIITWKFITPLICLVVIIKVSLIRIRNGEVTFKVSLISIRTARLPSRQSH